MKRIKHIILLVAVSIGLMATAALASPPGQAVHDVAVTDIQGPAGPVFQGAIATVNVTVSNQGTSPETITVVLRDDTDNRDFDTVILTLNHAETLAIGLQWNTERASGGEHTLTATANVPDDTEPGNNSRSTVTPTTVVATAISVDGADAIFGKGIVQPIIDTIAVEQQSLFVGNAGASFGQSVLQPNVDTVAMEKQSLFVGNADAIFQSRTTFRRPLPPDLNCDGAINILDAVIILQYIVGRLPVIECQGIPLFNNMLPPPR